MASVRSPRRQLAPTVGHEVALDGVHIRRASSRSPVSVRCPRVQHIYAMDFINDNAAASPTASSQERPHHRVRQPPRLLRHRPCAPLAGAGGTGPAKMAVLARRQLRGNDDRCGAGKEVAEKVLVARFPVRPWSATQAQRSIIRATGDTAQGAMNVSPPPSRERRSGGGGAEAQREDTRERQRRRRAQRELNLTVWSAAVVAAKPRPAAVRDKEPDRSRGRVQRNSGWKTVQRPVYYLSEVLSLSKQNYPHFQKMTYGVFMAATKLKHYFEEHPMKVVSEAPISDIMCNKDASGRIAKWAIQISPYVPVYERRDAIKSQALADFLVDWAEMTSPRSKLEYWKMHFDGSKLKEGLGAGVVLTSPRGDHLRYVLQVHFRASNNVAEYEALIHGLSQKKSVHTGSFAMEIQILWCAVFRGLGRKDANMASYRFHVQKIGLLRGL
ncbi:hypothetical protein QYE76_007015 [Lolium multiflorum]|uniref:Reverse transcriptase RNase H-like domain-containing protein n=1 Tax=Lolium multiflorum TaxID=4521 RepID=A0AAD8W2B0_LOLMU|nr:hypothetical protein QYE76_007015 [Lolium multiflorum]